MMNLDKYARKAAKLEDKRAEILRLEVDGEEFEFHKISDSDYDEIQTRIIDHNNGVGDDTLVGICNDLIYMSCPDLHEPELLETFGVLRPPDVVKKIFSPQEASSIGAELLTFNGMTETDTVKKI